GATFSDLSGPHRCAPETGAPAARSPRARLLSRHDDRGSRGRDARVARVRARALRPREKAVAGASQRETFMNLRQAFEELRQQEAASAPRYVARTLLSVPANARTRVSVPHLAF